MHRPHQTSPVPLLLLLLGSDARRARAIRRLEHDKWRRVSAITTRADLLIRRGLRVWAAGRTHSLVRDGLARCAIFSLVPRLAKLARYVTLLQHPSAYRRSPTEVGNSSCFQKQKTPPVWPNDIGSICAFVMDRPVKGKVGICLGSDWPSRRLKLGRGTSHVSRRRGHRAHCSTARHVRSQPSAAVVIAHGASPPK